MRKQNHVHKFRRHTYTTGNKVFFCTLDECNFKIDCALALGKRSICNRCGREFSLDEASIRLAKPHCQDCSKKRVKDEHGNTRYVRPEIIMKSIAEQHTEELKERLGSLIGAANEDDI